MSIKSSPDLGRLIARLGNDFEAGVASGMTHLVEEVEARAVKETPVRTSNLVNSIMSYVTRGGMRGIVQATAPYAMFVHEGTGIYGPHKQKIVIEPKTKKALFWPGAMHPVRRVVQLGIKANPFFKRAIEKLDGAKVMGEGIMAFLRRRGW